MIWSGKRGSNLRPKAWEAFTLPTELLPYISKYLERDIYLVVFLKLY